MGINYLEDRMNCSFCNEPAILLGGKKYCANHIYLHEKPIITNYITGLIPKRALDVISIEKFFKWAFNTTNPKLGDLQKLYERFPRGEWDEKRFLGGGFGYGETQESYVRRCYLMFLKESEREGGGKDGKRESKDVSTTD